MGCRELAGGWRMVAMEYLDPRDGWQALIHIKTSTPPELLAALEQAVHKAHQLGFAHGDWRDRNIFVRWWGSCMCAWLATLENHAGLEPSMMLACQGRAFAGALRLRQTG